MKRLLIFCTILIILIVTIFFISFNHSRIEVSHKIVASESRNNIEIVLENISKDESVKLKTDTGKYELKSLESQIVFSDTFKLPRQIPAPESSVIVIPLENMPSGTYELKLTMGLDKRVKTIKSEVEIETLFESHKTKVLLRESVNEALNNITMFQNTCINNISSNSENVINLLNDRNSHSYLIPNFDYSGLSNSFIYKSNLVLDTFDYLDFEAIETFLNSLYKYDRINGIYKKDLALEAIKIGIVQVPFDKIDDSNPRDEIWYEVVRNSKEIEFRDIDFDDDTKLITLTVDAPLYSEDDFLGVLTYEYRFNLLGDMVKHLEKAAPCNVYIADSNGLILYRSSNYELSYLDEFGFTQPFQQGINTDYVFGELKNFAYGLDEAYGWQVLVFLK